MCFQPDDSTQAKPNMLRDEFMLNMNKFVQQIRRTINQIEGRFGLEIPEGDGPNALSLIKTVLKSLFN